MKNLQINWTCRSIHHLETKYISNLTYFVLHLALIPTRVLGHLDTKFTFDRICVKTVYSINNDNSPALLSSFSENKFAKTSHHFKFHEEWRKEMSCLLEARPKLTFEYCGFCGKDNFLTLSAFSFISQRNCYDRWHNLKWNDRNCN